MKYYVKTLMDVLATGLIMGSGILFTAAGIKLVKDTVKQL